MNKPHTRAELAELVGSRICHDLISPIGAIANGLELLTMSGTSSGAEMDLIADSAGDAGARIGFFASPMAQPGISCWPLQRHAPFWRG